MTPQDEAIIQIAADIKRLQDHGIHIASIIHGFGLEIEPFDLTDEQRMRHLTLHFDEYSPNKRDDIEATIQRLNNNFTDVTTRTGRTRRDIFEEAATITASFSLTPGSISDDIRTVIIERLDQLLKENPGHIIKLKEAFDNFIIEAEMSKEGREIVNAIAIPDKEIKEYMDGLADLYGNEEISKQIRTSIGGESRNVNMTQYARLLAEHPEEAFADVIYGFLERNAAKVEAAAVSMTSHFELKRKKEAAPTESKIERKEEPKKP